MDKSKPLKECDTSNSDVNESKISKLSARNILSAIGSRFFSLSQESTDSEKTTVVNVVDKNDKAVKDKSKKEEKQLEKQVLGKDDKKFLLHSRIKEVREKHEFHFDRDFRRFKAKYNTSMGNIVRDWMSLIYCILFLRMNLIKFTLNSLLQQNKTDMRLEKQILFESKIIYHMVRDAQNLSQEKFLFMWTQLEKLIFSRKIFKNALQAVQIKETGIRDWKSAAAKLTELETEFEKFQELHNDAQKRKIESEKLKKEKILDLERLECAKEAEYNALVEKIADLKKRELQMRGKILINMKSYKDLKVKKEKLVNIGEELKKMKSEQSALVEEYSTKISSLKNDIEEKEKEIKEEKEEKKKIKATLVGFGDFLDKRNVLAVQDS